VADSGVSKQVATEFTEYTRSSRSKDLALRAKLRRGTFAATFLLATLAALEMGGMRLEDL
jgi:hypothetical protein